MPITALNLPLNEPLTHCTSDRDRCLDQDENRCRHDSGRSRVMIIVVVAVMMMRLVMLLIILVSFRHRTETQVIQGV